VIDTSACPPYRVIISNDRQDIQDTTWILLGDGCPESEASYGQISSTAINVLGLRCPFNSRLRLQISFVGIYDVYVPAQGGGDVVLNFSDILNAGDHGRPLPNGWTVKKIPF
jgi:hypothetical protein